MLTAEGRMALEILREHLAKNRRKIVPGPTPTIFWIWLIRVLLVLKGSRSMATDATIVKTQEAPGHDTLVPDPQVQLR